jgi:hypothetical protein
MRSDMPKLLVERPRGGPRLRHRRVNLRAVRDFDDLPKRVSIGHDNPRSKWLSENLEPLARLLERRVGMKWDSVYSEIREHVRFDNPIQQHVLQHLWQFVERHVVMIEGVPFRSTCLRPLSGYPRSFYVCPNSGILRRVAWHRAPGAPQRKHERKRNGSRR